MSISKLKIAGRSVQYFLRHSAIFLYFVYIIVFFSVLPFGVINDNNTNNMSIFVVSSQKLQFSPHNHSGVTELNFIKFAKNVDNIAIWYFKIRIVILQSVSERQSNEWRLTRRFLKGHCHGNQFCPKIDCNGNVFWGIGKIFRSIIYEQICTIWFLKKS